MPANWARLANSLPRKLHHEAHEGHEVKKTLFNPSFVIFVPFVVSYSSELVAALPR
jgi:hypothetical protein